MRRLKLLVLPLGLATPLGLVSACGDDDILLKFPKPWPDVDDDTGGDDDDDDDDDAVTGPGDGPDGFIGAPCDADSDCDFEGALCLFPDEGFPYGTCSAPCDRYCPDGDDAPVTFCVTPDDLPAEAPSDVDIGACLSRCDFSFFPDTGCRPGYGCAMTERPNAGFDDQNYACLPDRDSELTACHDALIDAVVPFEPNLREPGTPEGGTEAICEIADPVWILEGVDGVALLDSAGTPTPRVLTSCESALAIALTIRDVSPDGVNGLRHYGSYACRNIAGSSSISQHAYADAFDISGFEFQDGTVWNLVDDWEYGSSPSSEAGAWLYAAPYRWHDGRYWNIILTPNYNVDHYNHYHVDLTPGSDYIGVTDGRYVGPAPYAD
jgi:hypothetical protein